MIPRALNQKTLRHLSFEAFLDAAQQLGCVGVEPRNDLGRPFFDGIDPGLAGQMARDRGLRLLGLSEVYGFNVWDDERAAQIAALVETAVESGAETISLIPTVDARPTRALREVMRDIKHLVAGTQVQPLIEPIGFESSSLRYKAELVDSIEAVGWGVKLVHDTFQHCISGERELFAPYTAMVHISGISASDVMLDTSQDAHRVLVDERDRCGNHAQIAALLEAGYTGAFSFECTEPTLLERPNLIREIGASFRTIEADLSCRPVVKRSDLLGSRRMSKCRVVSTFCGSKSRSG
ncbi:TIM barrel protein [Sinirhodobacter sp. WL0062]|uniref:TIM barrel protein n=1 Tax=Rhodobacter flavimaris TaxID=2907145 RepID=A0ABS8YWZ8_9RHOB|nr:TIM barrel protein [Sinirhodobacter sp. WL0062]MCE5974033.1 TIM barrel protein [Sinirhodobacter sp. WL0062]